LLSGRESISPMKLSARWKLTSSAVHAGAVFEDVFMDLVKLLRESQELHRKLGGCTLDGADAAGRG